MRKSIFKGMLPILGLIMALLTVGEANAQIKAVGMFTSSSTSPILTKTEGTSFANNDLTVKFDKEVSGMGTATVIWRRNGDSIGITSTSASTITFRVTLGSSQYNLPVSMSDAGVYTATVRYYYSSDPSKVWEMSTSEASGSTLKENGVKSITLVVTPLPVTMAPFKPEVTLGVPGSQSKVTFSEGLKTTVTRTNSMPKLTATDTAAKNGRTVARTTSVKWYRNDVELKAGVGGFDESNFSFAANAATLQLNKANSPVSADQVNGDKYYCIMHNDYNGGSDTKSDVFYIITRKNPNGPTYATINNKTVEAGATVYDTVFVGNTVSLLSVGAPNNYTKIQWQKDGQDISGANEESYKPTSWTMADAGTYNFILFDSESEDDTTSQPIKITVIDPKTTKTIEVVKNPQSVNVIEGDTLRLGMQAKGIKISRYQWYANGQKVLFQSNKDSLKLPLTVISDTGSYYCVVYNEVDSAVTSIAKVTITRELIPLFVNLKDSYDGVTNIISSSMNMIVKGEGSENLTEWSVIDGTGKVLAPALRTVGGRSSYSLISHQAGTPFPAGKYTVRVTNADGTLVLEKAVEIK